jgi:ankyrin repeat protein
MHSRQQQRQQQQLELMLDASAMPGDSGLGTVCRLLNAGVPADVCDRNEHRMTPLMYAACKGNEHTCRALLRRGASLDRTNAAGETPLFMACANNNMGVVRVLVAGAGANTVIDRGRERDGVTALFAACEVDNLEMVDLLISAGAGVDRVKKDGATPLMASCFRGRLATAELLISRGADVNRTIERNGISTLIIACWFPNPAVVALLISKGADVNHATPKGKTALAVACARENLEVAGLLLSEGAEVNKPSLDGHTPLDVAARVRNRALCELLIAHGARHGSMAAAEGAAEAEVELEEDAAADREVAVKLCETCGKARVPGSRNTLCLGCRAVHYCDRACQRADWCRHKHQCRLAQQQRAAASNPL